MVGDTVCTVSANTGKLAIVQNLNEAGVARVGADPSSVLLLPDSVDTTPAAEVPNKGLLRSW